MREYEIESEAWYRAVAEGRELGASDRPVYDAPVYPVGHPGRMRPTPGSVAGTKVVVLVGGPPEYDGDVCGLSKTGSGRAERWDHTADSPVVYAETDDTIPVRIIHERRGGPKPEIHDAQVYRYQGYREDEDL